MQAPMGVSGVQTVPNSLHSVGFLRPRRMAGHSQAGLSSAWTVWMANRFSASKAAQASRSFSALDATTPSPRHSKLSRISNNPDYG
jgi:hypothetical protein